MLHTAKVLVWAALMGGLFLMFMPALGFILIGKAFFDALNNGMEKMIAVIPEAPAQI